LRIRQKRIFDRKTRLSLPQMSCLEDKPVHQSVLLRKRQRPEIKNLAQKKNKQNLDR